MSFAKKMARNQRRTRRLGEANLQTGLSLKCRGCVGVVLCLNKADGSDAGVCRLCGRDWSRGPARDAFGQPAIPDKRREAAILDKYGTRLRELMGSGGGSGGSASLDLAFYRPEDDLGALPYVKLDAEDAARARAARGIPADDPRTVAIVRVARG